MLISTTSEVEAARAGGGYLVHPPETPCSVSMFQRVPQASHWRYFLSTTWKLNEPQGSQTLMPVRTLPFGVDMMISGRDSPSPYRDRGIVLP